MGLTLSSDSRQAMGRTFADHSADNAVVVIGSGPAGAMAAHELIRQSIPVIMLEAGQTFPGGTLVRIMGRTVFRRTSDLGVENGKLHVSEGASEADWWCDFSPGGLSNVWTGAVPRFAPEDFTEGERLHAKYRWPISYDDLRPYYDQAERLIEITADPAEVPNLPASKPTYVRHLRSDWQAVAKVAERQGQGMTVLPLADGAPWMVARRGTAFNSYAWIVKRLLRSPHFRLLLGARALRLNYSPRHGQVESVVYHDHATGTEQQIRAAAVVVACGALNSTRLLFNSACADFPEGLGNSEGVLGRYLHDHPRDWWTFDVEKPLSRPTPSVYLTRIPFVRSAPLLSTSWTIGLAPSAREKALSFTPLKGNRFGVQVFGTMVPSERHYVKPSDNRRDAFGMSTLDLCIAFDQATVQNVEFAREHLLALLDEAGYRGKLHSTPTTLRPGDAVHYGGTIRMHHSRQYGMLDGWNRLHTVPNVVVADASCFTTGSEKNPTLTAMAIAARAADRLAHDLRTGINSEVQSLR